MARFWIPTLIGFLIIGTASAGTLYRGLASGARPLAIVAGEVNSDGTILKGHGFTVQHVGVGQYEVSFNRRYFPSGCAVMTVTGVGSAYYNPIPQVSPGPCNNEFTVYMEYPGVNKTVDQAFMFIAREAE